MIKTVLKALMLLSYLNIIYSLKSTDICFKPYECKNGFESCSFSSCTGHLLSYDCNRIECALDEESCDEYQMGVDEIIQRRNTKLDRAPTVSLMQGVSFTPKRLRNFAKMLKKIKICSV